jgi:sugar transferase (PEP-CTERM system associated)
VRQAELAMQVFNRYMSGRSVTLIVAEAGIVMAAFFVALHSSSPAPTVTEVLWRLVLVTFTYELCLYYSSLYDFSVVQSARHIAVGLLQAAGLASIVLGVIAAATPTVLISAESYLIALPGVVVAIALSRVAAHSMSVDATFDQNVLILGTGPMARHMARIVQTQKEFPYRLVGFIDDSEAATSTVNTLGHISELTRLVRAHDIRLIIVTASERRGKLPVQQLLQAKLAGVRIEDAATSYERLTCKILIDELKPSWMIFSDGFCPPRITRSVKRVLDLMLAAVGLVLAAPIMVLAWIAIRLDSPGPVLYRQERVGQHGQPFVLLKFRSMRSDAENGTPIWASAVDDRVTRIGRFIRQTRIDELPQLWNVLRGEMSFVGPRPERPYFVEQLTAKIPFYGERHCVKPGVTGWAQVCYRYGASVEDATEKLRYDLYYIKHLSLSFDLSILFDTVKVIVARRGAH